MIIIFIFMSKNVGMIGSCIGCFICDGGIIISKILVLVRELIKCGFLGIGLFFEGFRIDLSGFILYSGLIIAVFGFNYVWSILINIID